jgi:hypothetical protein
MVVNKSSEDIIKIELSLKLTMLTFNKIKIETAMDLIEIYKQIYTNYENIFILVSLAGPKGFQNFQY